MKNADTERLSRMKFVVFGGTTEGRCLSRALAESGAEVTVCVASDYGAEEQGESAGIRLLKGPLSPEEKDELLKRAELCVDATHPYARHITRSVKDACRRVGCLYLRLLRPPGAGEESPCFPSAEAVAEALKERKGNILLTTGSRGLQAFRDLEPERLYPRVLPSHEALSACEAMGIPHRNILAMQGPFSEELNAAIIRQYQIRFLVTKDGGETGGFPEKAAAAERTGAELLVIGRPEAEEGERYERILRHCLRLLEEPRM